LEVLILRLGLTFPACTGLKQEIPCGTPLPPIYFSASPLAGFCSLVISADSLTYCLLKLMSQLLSHQNLKEQLSSSVFLNSGSKRFRGRSLPGKALNNQGGIYIGSTPGISNDGAVVRYTNLRYNILIKKVSDRIGGKEVVIAESIAILVGGKIG
jgi:hypothetical protein